MSTTQESTVLVKTLFLETSGKHSIEREKILSVFPGGKRISWEISKSIT